MIDEILEHIYDNRDKSGMIPLTEIVKKYIPLHDLGTLQALKRQIQDDGQYAALEGTWKDTGQPIEELGLCGRIWAKGIERVLRYKQEKRLNSYMERQTVSIEETGTITRRTSRQTLIVAVITTIFIAGTFILSIVDRTPQRLQGKETQQKELSTPLKDTPTSLKEVNSSIQEVTTDTILGKKEKKR